MHYRKSVFLEPTLGNFQESPPTQVVPCTLKSRLKLNLSSLVLMESFNSPLFICILVEVSDCESPRFPEFGLNTLILLFPDPLIKKPLPSWWLESDPLNLKLMMALMCFGGLTECLFEWYDCLRLYLFSNSFDLIVPTIRYLCQGRSQFIPASLQLFHLSPIHVSFEKISISASL